MPRVRCASFSCVAVVCCRCLLQLFAAAGGCAVQQPSTIWRGAVRSREAEGTALLGGLYSRAGGCRKSEHAQGQSTGAEHCGIDLTYESKRVGLPSVISCALGKYRIRRRTSKRLGCVAWAASSMVNRNEYLRQMQ